LAAAYKLRHTNFVLLEKEPRCGGNAISEEWQGIGYSTGAAYTEGAEMEAFCTELGMPIHPIRSVDAAIAAAKTRLRPILMTSAAFIFGVIPLAFATGPGAELRQALGVGVFYGMIGVTVFGLVFTPLFYVLCRKLAVRFSRGSVPRVRVIPSHGAEPPRDPQQSPS